MVKKRAAKRTKTINYRREIWAHVGAYPLRTKDEICRLVKGSRTVVFAQINNLIDEKVLEYNGGKLSISAEDDLEIKRSILSDQLDNFIETRNNTIDQIKKRMAFQMPESEKKKLAHTTIENNGDIPELYTKLELFWEKLNIS